MPAVYNGTLPFLNVGQILNCILHCITPFKVEKNALRKNQKLSEVAVGGGGVLKLQTKSEVLCFILTFPLGKG